MYEHDSDGSDDDWFFTSIKRYDDLLMYNLHGVASCITFNDNDRFLVAVSREKVNEIWELSIPEKLVSGTESLPSKNRDFSMITAGYTTENISQMVSVPNGFIASQSTEVVLYSIPTKQDFSDMIQQKNKIRSCIKPVSLSKLNDEIYSCSHLFDVEAYNLSTESSTSLQPQNISNGEELRDLTVGCTRTSQLGLSLGAKNSCTLVTLDPRNVSAASVIHESSIQQDSNNAATALSWTFDITPDGTYVAFASSKGNIRIYDTRSTKMPLVNSNMNVEETSVNPNIRFGSSSLLSVSGYDKCINIYNIKSSLSELTHIFCHDGHRNNGMKEVLIHIWHPSSENLIFSADNTGELQSWRFKY